MVKYREGNFKGIESWCKYGFCGEVLEVEFENLKLGSKFIIFMKVYLST